MEINSPFEGGSPGCFLSLKLIPIPDFLGREWKRELGEGLDTLQCLKTLETRTTVLNN